MIDVPTHPVVLIDTSVLLNLLRVPGHCDQHTAVRKEFDRLRNEGARFILPITSLIETGNLISQCDGDRHGAAERFAKSIRAAKSADPPWTIRDVSWNGEFVEALLSGDSTGSDLVQHLTAKSLGTGDIAILVERDQFRADAAFTDIRVWTLDAELRAHS